MKILLNISFILLVSYHISAQEKFDFDYDYAQFAFDSTSNYIEIYYSFGQRSLTQNSTDSSIYLDGMLDIKITNNISQDVIVDKEWKISHEISDTMDMNKNLVGVLSFILPEGEYVCEITGNNFSNSTSSRSYKDSFTVVPFINDNISLSNIQLASNILQDSKNTGSVFYKNSFEIIPLPASIYGENLPVVFHYVEVYNLQTVNNDNPLKLTTLVYNSRNTPVFSKSKNLTKIKDSRVEVGTILVNKFPTDTYTMVIALFDSTNNYGVSSSKRFYVLNPAVEMSDSLYGSISDVFASHFGVMSEEELDDLFQKSRYIATQQEIEQYKSLTGIEGKQKFLFNFWNVRDSDPSTPRNEFYTDYLRRIKISNEQFGSMGKPGWKTDRGRIFMKYGEPSEIERFPNQIDTKPYEIWHYNEIEGGVIFVFADLTSFSEYQLIHSTARGELRDDNWYRRIRSI